MIDNVLRNCLAPAKLNLFLHVVGRKPNGYHELQSVMQLIDWCDVLHFRLLQNGAIKRISQIAYVNEEADIVVKAAKLLQTMYSVQLGVEVEIEKNIPWGAGMGGGSSDAATTLYALNRLWNLNLTNTQLMECGFQLGADVPFFLLGGNAWVEGVGEVLQPIELPPTQFLVCFPNENCSTADIFSDPDLTRDTKKTTIASFLNANEHRNLSFKNDLESVVCKKSQKVKEAFLWLKQFGIPKMTGSGSAVFVEVLEKGFELPKPPFNFVLRLVSTFQNHPFIHR